jgi:hypothetical protein
VAQNTTLSFVVGDLESAFNYSGNFVSSGVLLMWSEDDDGDHDYYFSGEFQNTGSIEIGKNSVRISNPASQYGTVVCHGTGTLFLNGTVFNAPTISANGPTNITAPGTSTSLFCLYLLVAHFSPFFLK